MLFDTYHSALHGGVEWIYSHPTQNSVNRDKYAFTRAIFRQIGLVKLMRYLQEQLLIDYKKYLYFSRSGFDNDSL